MLKRYELKEAKKQNKQTNQNTRTHEHTHLFIARAGMSRKLNKLILLLFCRWKNNTDISITFNV